VFSLLKADSVGYFGEKIFQLEPGVSGSLLDLRASIWEALFSPFFSSFTFDNLKAATQSNLTVYKKVIRIHTYPWESPHL
jgi:hypothetical protein